MTSRQSTAGGEESEHQESEQQELKHQESGYQDLKDQESKNDLHHGDRGELARSNDRRDQFGYQSGGQHGGGHLQHPPSSHPSQSSYNATGYLPTAHHGPIPSYLQPPLARSNTTDYLPTAQHGFLPPPNPPPIQAPGSTVPQNPRPSRANYPHGQYPPQNAPTGQHGLNQPAPHGIFSQVPLGSGNEPPHPSSQLYGPNQTWHTSYNSVNGEEEGKEKKGGKKRTRSQANIDQDPSAGSRGSWDLLRRDLGNTLRLVFYQFKEIDKIEGHSTDEEANLTIHFTVSRSQDTGEVNVNTQLNGPSGEQRRSG
ncbi:hypothetical protein FGLOB1_8447 [Fusarium globosum]|uniref:Uncharacterized protein n=1 Tax=Fusarium globosum TaxID=78864 RepID=A0A8H5Y3E1_9HYPO|nr:hypothetical protein FGLOB1_8447 [Fusarium globosum]